MQAAPHTQVHLVLGAVLGEDVASPNSSADEDDERKDQPGLREVRPDPRVLQGRSGTRPAAHILELFNRLSERKLVSNFKYLAREDAYQS